jgi:hypothetical protein
MSRRKKRTKPKYAPGVLEHLAQAQAAGKLKPGTVYMIDVRHDNWCALLAGIGPCNCNPEVCPPERVPSSQEN